MTEGSPPSFRPAQPVIVAKPAHPISRQDIDPDVLRIVYRLDRLGFTAYITGGAVRDLLLERPAKDFDIVTNARPGQVKKRFANAYVIGRRFRLVHILFRDGKAIEVATFRGAAGRVGQKPPEGQAVPPEPYGTPGEDALRRDITINGLFYDVIHDVIIDYVGGLEDLARRVVRVIGDPAERFAEDPVRIWRVLRHAARLGFTVDEPAERSITSQAALVGACSGARLYEEFNKDLAYETGPVIEALRRYGLLRHILGKAGRDYEADDGLFSRLRALLEVKDKASAAGLALSLVEMYGLFFWPWLEPLLRETRVDLHKILNEAFQNADMKVKIPRSLRADLFQTLIIVAAMMRAMRTGQMRWSLTRRPEYKQAFRLFILISNARPPRTDESFAALFQEAFPSAGSPRRRRRRPGGSFARRPF